jgi:hypothetical protein
MKNEPLIFFHLKLVAKISLAIGAVAMIALVIALTMITDQSGASYSAIVQVQHLKSENLGKVMLLAGLVLLAITGLVTWLIALYSSFRIAGPLYRFSQNLQLATANESAALINIREGDSLQQEEEMIKQTVMTVRAYHAAVTTAARQASDAIAAGDESGYALSIARLRMLDEKIRI